MFEPQSAAGVGQYTDLHEDFTGRLERTAYYFLTIVYADSATAVALADHLAKVHTNITGIEPITGARYRANAPEQQMWVHLTTWHSMLHCYETFGPGKLSEADELRYWAECRTAAEMQICDPDQIPRNREEVRAYFAQWRPKLCMGEHGLSTMDMLLRFPLRPDTALLWPAAKVASIAALPTIPRWMRHLAGYDQSRLTDAAAVALFRVALAVMALPALKNYGALLSRAGNDIRSQALYGPAPERPVTVTPEAAKTAAGLPQRRRTHQSPNNNPPRVVV